MALFAQVRAALDAVRDPELDEPITTLGFVETIEGDGDTVHICLRLPTAFCAPNFAYMMVADARRAVVDHCDVRQVTVSLAGHAQEDEITSAVNSGQGFADAFPGEAMTGLEELRALFARKAFLVRQARVCDALLAAGLEPTDLAMVRLDQLPAGPDTQAYLEQRQHLGMSAEPQDALLVTPAGEPVGVDGAQRHVRMLRTVRVSVEHNAGFCRDVLARRVARESHEGVGS
jgi:metal-sulfur cluster biosynthetic enzyme